MLPRRSSAFAIFCSSCRSIALRTLRTIRQRCTRTIVCVFYSQENQCFVSDRSTLTFGFTTYARRFGIEVCSSSRVRQRTWSRTC
eukprot:1729268-Rhodomonas_salina.1